MMRRLVRTRRLVQTRRLVRILILGTGVVPAIIPTSCARPVLRELTPFLIDGGNQFMHDLIFLAAPLVLP